MLLGTLVVTMTDKQTVIVDVNQGKLLNPDGTVISNLSNQLHGLLQEIEQEVQIQVIRIGSPSHTDYAECTCGDPAKVHTKAYTFGFVTYYGCTLCACDRFK